MMTPSTIVSGWRGAIPRRSSSYPPRTGFNWTAFTELAPISNPTVSLRLPNPNMAEAFTVRKLRAQAHVHTLPINDNILICQVKNGHRIPQGIFTQRLGATLRKTPRTRPCNHLPFAPSLTALPTTGRMPRHSATAKEPARGAWQRETSQANCARLNLWAERDGPDRDGFFA